MSAKKKTGGRKSTDSLKPFNKTLPLSPSTVPENATVDDYQKVASDIINSSDDIIDRALDRIEGKTEAEKIREKEETKKETTVSETAVSQTAVCQQPEISPKEKIQTEELTELKDKFQISEKNNGFLREEIKRLSDENDEYLLKNSELEFENSRLRAENNFLKGEIEKSQKQTRLPPQTFSKEGYTRGPLPGSGFRGNNTVMTGPRRTQNGYESWN